MRPWTRRARWSEALRCAKVPFGSRGEGILTHPGPAAAPLGRVGALDAERLGAQ